MANYKAEIITGEKRTRSYAMIASNPLKDAPISVTFKEEDVYTLNGTVSSEPSGCFSRTLIDGSIAFPLINPATDEPIGEGINANLEQLYVTCYSLYLFLAKQRDAGAPDGTPVVQEWPIPEPTPEPTPEPPPEVIPEVIPEVNMDT